MKNKALIILALTSSIASADGVYIFGEIFVYDDNNTKQDYQGLSPNGIYGIRYIHDVDDELSVSFGYKHESSMSYREQGEGFNGVFISTELKVF